MSNDEVRFLPFAEAVDIVGAIQEEEDIEDPKFSQKMLIFSSNRQFGSNSWIRADEVGAFNISTPQMQFDDYNPTMNP